jgi:hypothetical protein
MFSHVASPLLVALRADTGIDHGRMLEFEFMDRAPVMPDLFAHLASDSGDLMRTVATYTHEQSVLHVLQFLGVEVNAAMLHFVRVLAGMADADIADVTRARSLEPRLSRAPSLRDVMAYLLQLDRMSTEPRNRHRVGEVLARHDFDNIGNLVQQLPADRLRGVVAMLAACMTHLAGVDTSKTGVAAKHARAFAARLKRM